MRMRRSSGQQMGHKQTSKKQSVSKQTSKKQSVSRERIIDIPNNFDLCMISL